MLIVWITKELRYVKKHVPLLPRCLQDTILTLGIFNSYANLGMLTLEVGSNAGIFSLVTSDVCNVEGLSSTCLTAR